MKKGVLLVLCTILIPAVVKAQEDSRIGLSINGDFFPEFQIHESEFNPSSAFGFQLSFYDADFTGLRYSFHYSRGYHNSISYSAGLSAGYVISLSEGLFITPGLGIMEYKMKDRTCRTSFRSVMNRLFDIYEPCPDDSHHSFNLFLTAELKISEPISIIFQTDYRAMLSSVSRLAETHTESLPGGGKTEREIHKTENFFYGAGLGFGIGLRIDLF